MSRRLWRFALISLVGTLVVLMFLAFFYHHNAVADLESAGDRHNLRVSTLLARSLRPEVQAVLQLPDNLTRNELQSRPEVAALHRELLDFLRGSEVVKVKIYAPDGRTVYSSELAQIGDSQVNNAGFQQALAGTAASTVIHRDTFNASDGVVEDRDLLETYIPVDLDGRGAASGVFELYTDVTPLLQQIRATRHKVVAGAVIIMSVFYLLLLGLYKQSEIALSREEKERDRHLDEIKQAKDTLEQRVAQRTHELAGSRRFLQSVIDGVADPVVVIDLDYRITSMNLAARRLVPDDYDGEQSLHCYELLHRGAKPCDVEGHACPMKQLLATAQPVTLRHEHVGATGQARYMEVMATPLRDASGEVVGMVEVNHDITELTLAVDALRRSEQRFRDVANAAGEFIWELDAQGRYSFVTERVRSVLGYAPEQMLGRRPIEFMRDAEARRVEMVFAGDEAQSFHNFEHCAESASGEEVWLNVSGIPFFGQTGALLGHRGVAQDITDRKRAELALRESEASLHAVMDSVVDGLLTIDEFGHIEMVNPAAEALFGYTADELRGRNVNMLMPEPYHSAHGNYIAHYLRTGEAKVIGVGGREVSGLRRDGSAFPLELAVGEMRPGVTRKFVGVVRDLTDRKRAERELEETRSKYFHNEKMAAIGQLAAGIIHEVGNPIAAIAGSVQHIALAHDPELGGEPLDAQIKEHLDLISEHTERISNITREIADFASPKPRVRELLDLNGLVRSSSHLLRYDSRWRRIETRLDLDPSLPAIVGVADQLTQVIMNLLINAADACEQTVEPALIRVSSGVYDDGVWLAVEDNGSGMSEDTLQHACDAFFTTKPEGKGTGLGLSLCSSMVHSHGGSIEIESTPGQGTRIRVKLPLQASVEAGEQQSA